MSIIGSNVIAGASGQAGYNLNNSLRFRSSASAYLSRTFTTPTSGQKWTISFWIKRGTLGVTQQLFAKGNTAASPWTLCYFGANDTLNFYEYNTGGTASNFNMTSNAFYRDPSAWYHIVVAVDTTQATPANRQIIYVNGSAITFSTSVYYPQNTVTTWNSSGGTSYIGAQGGGQYYDGYMTELNFIDGQQLTPSSFGNYNSATGVWQPAKYTGTYGTNGFYLNFNSIALTSGSNTGLGKDNSGNGNYWNTNNISVTAGTTYDAMLDVPTNTSATVANYSVINPIWAGYGTPTLSNANLTSVTTSAQTAVSTMTFPNSSKTYLEATFTAGTAPRIGIRLVTDITQYGGWVVLSSGSIRLNDVDQQTGLATFTTNDVIGIAVDLSANTLQFYKNNVALGTANTITNSSDWVTQTQCNSGAGNTCTIAWNFGQRPFSYTPPTGYVALNTYNLPTTTILQGNKYMDATLYAGNAVGLTAVNQGQFKPDLVWIKDRTQVAQHVLTDSVRGTSAQLFSSLTNAEQSNSTYVTSFNSNGFTVGVGNAGTGVVNNNGDNFVGWQWQAGQGSTSSNTSGSITSTVSVNTTAGFSVVTYTGTGANATVGHGLGVAPKMVIVKKRSAASSWVMYHGSLAATQRMILETTAAVATDASVWNSTAPTSSVFSLGNDAGVNGSGATLVAYCWADVSGYSKAFSYTGNGSADGSFVFLGFLPRFVMIKRTDTTGDWYMWDTARNTYDVITNTLLANSSAAETSATSIDALSNGFKLRNTTAGFNASGGTYIGMAWATNPFKNSNAF